VVSVVLCISTCRRPEGLTRLLEAVATLEDVDARLSVVVVENDLEGQGLEVCRRLAPTYRWPLRCLVEERRGFVFPRNRAVAAALEENPDFIAQLDDDGWPSPRWLAEMLRVQRATDADMVGGPVIARFACTPPSWLQRSDFYFCFSDRRPDMARCFPIGSLNVLIRAQRLRALMPRPFDPRFNLTGGEDSLLFHQLAVHGARAAWAAHAHAFETIPEHRMSMTWLRRRTLRYGSANVRVERIVAPHLTNEFLRLAKTFGLLGVGALRYLTCWPHPVARRHAELMLWRAIGKLSGHAGHYYLDPR
jgi:succinoglycan biosynthesis protein ExoM